MSLACNIDHKGRRLRAILGVGWLVAALVAAVLLWPMTWKGWLVVLAIVLIAAFHIFEATKGWCAVRAMGWRTPI